jgi:hypothetical protein
MFEQQVSFCGPPAVQVPAVQVVGGAVGQLLAQVVALLPGSQLPEGRVAPPVPPAAAAPPELLVPAMALPPGVEIPPAPVFPAVAADPAPAPAFPPVPLPP